ncbi:MAG: hypothetical protein HOP29_16575 [Phycisphaerales bacterium]|nr:hypothetical protein [Phycisphaerales bacterium]
MSKLVRLVRNAAMLGSAVIIFQLPGCQPASFLEFAQTVFLGVTAAGSLVIISNL